jgi:hypothetical protein
MPAPVRGHSESGDRAGAQEEQESIRLEEGGDVVIVVNAGGALGHGTFGMVRSAQIAGGGENKGKRLRLVVKMPHSAVSTAEFVHEREVLRSLFRGSRDKMLKRKRESSKGNQEGATATDDGGAKTDSSAEQESDDSYAFLVRYFPGESEVEKRLLVFERMAGTLENRLATNVFNTEVPSDQDMEFSRRKAEVEPYRGLARF